MENNICELNIIRLKLIIFFVVFLNGVSCTNDRKEHLDEKNIVGNNDTTVFQFAYPRNLQTIEDSLSHYFGLSEISPLKGDSLIRFFVYGDSDFLVIDLDNQNYKAKVIQFLAEGNGVDGFLKIKKTEEYIVYKDNAWWRSLDSLLFNKKIGGLNGEYYTPSTGGYSVCIQQRFKNDYCYAVVYNPEAFINIGEAYNNEDLIKKNVGLIMSFLFGELSIKSKMFEGFSEGSKSSQ